MNINTNHKCYFIKDKNLLNNENLSKKLWFIINQQPKNDIEYHNIYNISNIYYNMLVYKCKYNVKVEKKINNFI